MGSLIRLIIGAPLAVLATIIIFLAMYGLIKSDSIELLDEKDAVNLQIGRRIIETDPNQVAKDFERPQLDTPPPPPPAINQADFRPSVDGVSAARPEFDAKVDIGTGFNPDRDAQPLVRIPPQYPDRCASRHNKSEIVEIEFDVTPDGQVVNVQIVASTNSCFDSASIRAAERWKYQPKIVEGQAQPRYGVRTNFRYEPPA